MAEEGQVDCAKSRWKFFRHRIQDGINITWYVAELCLAGSCLEIGQHPSKNRTALICLFSVRIAISILALASFAQFYRQFHRYWSLSVFSEISVSIAFLLLLLASNFFQTLAFQDNPALFALGFFANLATFGFQISCHCLLPRNSVHSHAGDAEMLFQVPTVLTRGCLVTVSLQIVLSALQLLSNVLAESESTQIVQYLPNSLANMLLFQLILLSLRRFQALSGAAVTKDWIEQLMDVNMPASGIASSLLAMQFEEVSFDPLHLHRVAVQQDEERG